MAELRTVECPYCQMNTEVQSELFVHVCAGCERTVRALPMATIKPKPRKKKQ